MAFKTFPLGIPIRASDGVSNVLDKISGKFGKFGAKLRNVGKGLTLGVTAPLVAFGTLSVGASVNFDKAMNRVQAKLGETVDGVSVLRDQARKLGADTEFSATQAGEGMAFLAQAGFDTQETFKAIPSILTLAAAAELDLATAADLATNVLTGFGKSVDELPQVVDNLASATVRGNTNLVQLADGLKFAGPTAKALGQDFVPTIALLDKLADAGFQGELGGNALKRGMLSLIKPSRSAKDAFRKLKIASADIFTEEGQLRKFDEILALLEKRGVKGIQIFDIFGARAGPGMAALLGIGTEEIKRLAAAIDGDLNRATEIQNIQMQGTIGQLARLRSKFEALLITIGESGLIDAFSFLIDKLSSLIDWMKDADPRILRLGLVFAGVAAAVGPLLIVLGTLASGLGGIVTVGGVLMPILISLSTWILATAIPAIGAFALAIATALGPVGLILIAINAIVIGGFLLVKNWDTIKEKAKAVWGGILFAIKNPITAIKALLLSVIDLVPDWLLNFLGGNTGSLDALNTAATGPEPSEATLRAAGAGTVSRSESVTTNESRVTIDVKAPPGTRAEVEGGAIPIDVDLGVTMLAPG